MKSYGELAQVYDRLMDHLDWSRITDFYLALANRLGYQGGPVLDLACGTGNIMLELLRKGCQVWGVDLAEKMLAVADRKIYEAGFKPMLLRQDMREMRLPQSFELVICAFDSLNYLLDERDVRKALRNVYKVLDKGGLFLFDVHSFYKFRVLLGNRTITWSEEDLAYIWQNCYRPRSRICTMKLDIFLRQEDQSYRRLRELHRERYYSLIFITRMLADQGFQNLGVFGDMKYTPPASRTERLFFAAGKV